MTFVLGFVAGAVVGVGSLVALALWRSSKAGQAMNQHKKGMV